MTNMQILAMDRTGETGEPIFRAPSVGCSGETGAYQINSRYADVEIRDTDDKLLAVVHAGKEQVRIVRAIAAIAATAATGETS
jgi:hypothetical protein